MRTAVVVGILALLWSAAEASPKKRRRGTFADCISELLDDMYRARARVVVAGTHGGVREELTKMAGWGDGKLIMLDDRPGDQQLFDELRAIARPQSRTPVTSRRRSSTPRTPDRSR